MASAAVMPADVSAQDDIEQDVEIDLELPRCKVEALLAQLGENASALKATFPLAHVAQLHERGVPEAAIPAPPPVGQFDPVEKLARLRDLQARFATVTERRQQAEETKRALQVVPSAASANHTSPALLGPSMPSSDVEVPAAPFPPPEGLPFPYRGVPGVLPPRAVAPPEPDPDPTDGDISWMLAPPAPGEEIAQRAILPKPTLLFQKDGMDMAFQQMRADGARMAANVREVGRQIVEGAEEKEIQDLRGLAPELKQSLLQQQRIIHEQQRVIEEVRAGKQVEEERSFWLEREQRQARQAHIYGDRLIGGTDAAEDMVGHRGMAAGPRDADKGILSGDDSPEQPRQAVALRHMSAPDGAGEAALPLSHFEVHFPSQEFQRRLKREAEEKNWPVAGSQQDVPVVLPQRGAVEERKPATQAPLEGSFFAGFAEPPARQLVKEERAPFAAFSGFALQEIAEEPVQAPFAAFSGHADEEAQITPRSGRVARPSQSRDNRSVTPPARVKRHSFNFKAQTDGAPAAPAGPSKGGSFFGSGGGLSPNPRLHQQQSTPRSNTESHLSEDVATPVQEPPAAGGVVPAWLFGGGTGSTPPAVAATPQPPQWSGHFMDGACLEKVASLCPPDVEAVDLAGVFKKLWEVQSEGRLGAVDAAQLVLDYVATVAGNAKREAGKGEAATHVRMVVDVLNFYPKCVQIHLWGLEALMALFRNEAWDVAESLARPIFDTLSFLMDIHQKEPGLRAAMPELPTRLLAGLALVLTPSTAPRLRSSHVDFTLGLLRAADAGPISLEHGLQVLLVAQSTHELGQQVRAARDALRRFKVEPRLVPRALLALGTIYAACTRPGSSSGGNKGDRGADRGTHLVSRDQQEHTSASDTGKDQQKAAELARAILENYSTSAGPGGVPLVPIGLQDITIVLDLYAQDRKIQGAGTVALGAALHVPGASIKAMSQEGVVRAIALALKRFPSSRSIALHFCDMVACIAQSEGELLSAEVVLDAVRAGLAFQRDEEVMLRALQALGAMAPRLKELCAGHEERLVLAARDLVQMGEACHTDPHALGLLLVTLTIAASDGHGSSAGGVAGDQWRKACGKTAAVAVPLRALYEHTGKAHLVYLAAITLRCLTFSCQASCAHAGRLKVASIVFSALEQHRTRPALVRELLAALANCAADGSTRQDFQALPPEAVQAIYPAMERSAGHEPDAVAQGCRALAALDANIDWSHVGTSILKAAVSISERAGEEVEQNGVLGIFGESKMSGAVQARRSRLHALCTQLVQHEVASESHFGRLVDAQGEPTPECLANRQLSTAARRSGTPRRSGIHRGTAAEATVARRAAS